MVRNGSGARPILLCILSCFFLAAVLFARTQRKGDEGAIPALRPFSLKVPLDFTIPKARTGDEWYFSVAQHLTVQTQRPSAIRHSPKDARLFGTIEMANRSWAFALMRSKKGGTAFDRLVLDSNQNGDLTDDPVPIAKVRTSKRYLPGKRWTEWRVSFYPVGLNIAIKKTAVRHALLLNFEGQDQGIYEARYRTYCYWSGTIPPPLGPLKVALIDYNSNGLLGDEPPKHPDVYHLGRGDLFLTDDNGDGNPFNDGMPPLPKLLHLKGGYYQLSLNLLAGSPTLTLAPYRGPAGILSAPYPQMGLGLFSDRWGPLIVRLQNGKALIPEGTYQILEWEATARDDQNHLWSLGAYRAEEGTRGTAATTFSVRKDSLTPLPIPSTLRTILTVEHRDTSVEFNLTLMIGSFRVGFLRKDKKNPPEPILKIVDETGKVVTQLKFHYG